MQNFLLGREVCIEECIDAEAVLKVTPFSEYTGQAAL
jgi:hypothetical protein